jgi:glucosamine-6-phosphate deaminase
VQGGGLSEAPAPLVVADAGRAGAVVAELVANRLTARPRARLLMAAEPGLNEVCAALRERWPAGAAPTVLQLHEYAGGGVADALRRQVGGVPLTRLVTLDGSATDLDAEARRHEAEVESAPIDVALLALGEDGRVALDEPPAGHASGVRIVRLPDGREGITVGLGTLWRARELLLVAIGRTRAAALRAMLDEPAGPGSPASLLRDHPRATVVCDHEAVSLLAPRPGITSDRVLIVLGHREPGISPEHRISHESRARLRHARDIAERMPVRAAVLTGYTSTGGLSEAEQMKASWDESLAPALLEVAGRNTAENASRSLPIVLSLGDVRHVVVVSSAWHIRVPYFFAPYRRYGLHVAYRASFAHGSWPRMLAHELRSLPRMRASRALAFAHARTG